VAGRTPGGWATVRSRDFWPAGPWHKSSPSLRFSRGTRILVALVAATLSTLPPTGTARAQEAETPTKVATILVTFDPGATEQARVVAAVRAHLSGVPVRVLLKPVARSASLGQSVAAAGELARQSGALGTFSIELGEDGAFLIFFTEPGGASALIRRLAPNDQGVRVTVEEAAIVVGSLVLALLEGRRIGMASAGDAPPKVERPRKTPPPRQRQPPKTRPRERPAEPKPEPESEPEAEPEPAPNEAPTAAERDEAGPAPASPTTAVTTAYAGTDFASGAKWQSGFTLGVRWIALRPLYAAARYTLFPALEGGTTQASVSIARHPGELVVGYVGPTRLAANAELGMVIDYTSRQTRGNGPDFEPTPRSGRWTVALGARAGASFAVVPSMHLAARGGADLLLTRYAYVTPDARAVVRPHRVRPRLDLELAMSLW
jgi:hypothetical protein